MNKIKLIALDLDGTALTPQNKVAETTTDAVRRAREAGVHVVVSTGRICGEARDFAIDLDADDLMVTSGGATLSSISGEGCTMQRGLSDLEKGGSLGYGVHRGPSSFDR